MTLEEILAALKAHDAAAVAAGLQAHVGDVYQSIFGAGHRKAAGEAKTKTKELENKNTELSEQVTTLTDQVTELQGKQPDLAKIREAHATEVQRLKDKHKAEIGTLNQKILTGAVERAKADLKVALTSKGLNADWVDVQVEKAAMAGRIKPKDDGSGVEVMQAGTETPFAPGEGQTAIGLLAAELDKGAPALMRNSSGDRGAGDRTQGGTGSGGGAGSGTGSSGGAKGKWGSLKEKLAEERKQQERPQGGSAIDRLSGTRPATS